MSQKNKDQVTPEEENQIDQPDKILADPGAMLTVAREAQGITIDRAARELGLTESAVRALEANQHDRFPAGIYVRGYIKNYCKILQLNPSTVMDVLEEFITLNGTLSSHGSNYDPSGELGREKKKSSPWIIPSVIVVLAVVAYVIYQFI